MVLDSRERERESLTDYREVRKYLSRTREMTHERDEQDEFYFLEGGSESVV